MEETLITLIERLLYIIDSIEERNISLTEEETAILLSVEDEFYCITDRLEEGDK